MFIYYHRIDRLIVTSSGYIFDSSLEFIHRIPYNTSPVILIVWNPTLLYELPSPSPSPQILPVAYHCSVSGPRSRRL